MAQFLKEKEGWEKEWEKKVKHLSGDNHVSTNQPPPEEKVSTTSEQDLLQKASDHQGWWEGSLFFCFFLCVSLLY